MRTHIYRNKILYSHLFAKFKSFCSLCIGQRGLSEKASQSILKWTPKADEINPYL